MFDPSFFELLVICIVALVALGPDRLPGAIRTVGLWVGRLRRSFNNIKREIEQEVGADEIRRQLRNEDIMEKFKNTKTQVTKSIDSIKSEAESIKNDLNLTKGLSDNNNDATGVSNPEPSSDTSDTIDPIEKLATSDPSARIIKPESSADSAQKEPEPQAEAEPHTAPSPNTALADDTQNDQGKNSQKSDK